MEARLKVLEGPFAGHAIPISKEKFLIGREPDCECVLDNPSVSRHHCVLLLDDWTLRIRDLGSTNGTLVNDFRIAAGDRILENGDVIAVGAWVARVELSQVNAPKKSADDSLPTGRFESDTTQFDMTTQRPAELRDKN